MEYAVPAACPFRILVTVPTELSGLLSRGNAVVRSGVVVVTLAVWATVVSDGCVWPTLREKIKYGVVVVTLAIWATVVSDGCVWPTLREKIKNGGLKLTKN